MPRIIKTPEAVESLRQIVQHIARDNLSAALHWLDEIQSVCQVLAAQPEIGQRMQTIRFGEVRQHVVGNYVIYYRPIDGGAEILLVAHGAREQNRFI